MLYHTVIVFTNRSVSVPPSVFASFEAMLLARSTFAGSASNLGPYIATRLSVSATPLAPKIASTSADVFSTSLFFISFPSVLTSPRYFIDFSYTENTSSDSTFPSL